MPEWAVGASNALVKVSGNINAEVVMTDNLMIWDDGTSERINGTFSQWHDDAHILALSTVLSETIMQRLGKSACVRIRNFGRLKHVLNEQLGSEARHEIVEYTSADRRDHFVKGTATAWQSEYRFVWQTGGGEQRWVTLPRGIASRVL